MIDLLRNEFSEVAISQSFTTCCSDYKPVSPEIEKICTAIDDLANMIPTDLIINSKAMEAGLKEKCAEIKR